MRRRSAAFLLAMGLALAPRAEGVPPDKRLTQLGLDSWQIEHGLPQNTVYSVAQTPDGYLWLGTAEGLARFDGVRFVSFDRRNTPAIRNNVVSTLHVSRDGSLWVGTEGGLVRVRGGVFELLPLPDLQGERITALLEARDGALWVGTSEAGVRRLAGGKVERIGIAQGLPGERVRAIVEAPDGTVWVGTEGVGVAGFAAGKPVRHLGRAQGLKSERVRSLLVDRDGALWVGCYDGGLDVVRGSVVTNMAPLAGLDRETVWRMVQDRGGAVWVATAVPGQGLRRFFEGRVDRLDSSMGLPTNDVWSLAEDTEGSLWIGLLGGGLARLRDGRFTPFTRREGLGGDNVRAVAHDRKGAIWVGTEGGGLSRIEGQSVTRTLMPKDGLLTDRVYSLVEDQKGALWIGGVARGLNRIQDGRLSTYRAPGDAFHSVHTILASRSGSLWLGTFRDGLFRLDITGEEGSSISGRLTPFTTREGLSSDVVVSLLEDRAGALWVGTAGGGLNRIMDGRITRFGEREGLSSPFVYALHEDDKGALWIGTFGGGLGRLRNGTFSAITAANGLFDDVVYGIVDDGIGFLWLTCNRGIFRVKKAELDDVADGRSSRLSSTVFGLPDGLPSVECNSGGQPTARTPDGRLWFATVKGVASVDPRRISQSAFVPPVHIEDVVIDGRSAGRLARLEVPPGTESLEIHYTALSLRAPSRVQFRFRLHGLDGGWTEAGTRRVAYYNRVPHGTYTFQVIASNEDGVFHQTGARLPVRVVPRFRETPWFYALLAVVGAAAIVGGHRLRVRHLQRRQTALVRLVDARTAELRLSEARAQEAREEAVRASQAKSTFLARMSHELRTPLNAILGFVQLMEQEGDRPPRDREHLGIVTRSGEHLLRLINDVLSLAKIESGRLSLKDSAFSPLGLLREVEDLFRLGAADKGLSLIVEAPGLPGRLWGDEGKLRQVLINLVGNAIKFTPRGHVRVRASYAEARLFVEVSDTGPGIPAGERSALFLAFSQTQVGRASREGTGLGLAISRSFVELMGGMLTAHDAPGGGASFRLEVPLPEAGAPVLSLPSSPPARRIVVAPGQKRRRLLVADDSPENRLLLNRLFASAGMESLEVSDGQAAVLAWEEWRPDLICMDMRMEQMDGSEATRLIRARETVLGRPRIPIIALTASALGEDHAAILEAGCDEIVPKPFRATALWEVLARHLGLTLVDAVRDETGENGAATEPVREIPQELRAPLHAAVLRADLQEALRLVEGMRGRDAGTAEALAAMLRAYRFDEVLTLTGQP